jgi:hypothetical protein
MVCCQDSYTHVCLLSMRTQTQTHTNTRTNTQTHILTWPIYVQQGPEPWCAARTRICETYVHTHIHNYTHSRDRYVQQGPEPWCAARTRIHETCGTSLGSSPIQAMIAQPQWQPNARDPPVCVYMYVNMSAYACIYLLVPLPSKPWSHSHNDNQTQEIHLCLYLYVNMSAYACIYVFWFTGTRNVKDTFVLLLS